ncbi:reverse transcriptase domain-containing protein [Tanacetum coccineum]
MQEECFLGYKVSTNGLRACPDKADAVLSLPSLRCIKDVQKLNGKLASLNRFLSKSAEKSLPFQNLEKMHKKDAAFHGTPKAEEAFKQMKKLITELPTLTAPREHEELIIYLAAAKEAISARRKIKEHSINEKEFFERSKRRRKTHEYTPIMHSGPRSVVAKVIQTGYYWPTMHMDARNLIRECNDYIAGPFPEGPDKVKFLIVAIDYFTKWIEAKAVATITDNQVKKFVWDNIVCRFGLPGEIISDNGKQFRDNPFKDWCEKLCIRQCFAFELDKELPACLMAHRTMIKSSNGETPFSLTYGTEVVIPTEIGMPTLRTAKIDKAKNNEALGINLDLIEERREQAAIQEAKSKKKMEKYYNSRVCGTSFKPGDMVYRSNEVSHAKDEGKLGPKWEGPYDVKESLGKGAYKLKDCKGSEMPRTLNTPPHCR